jgi:ABC-type transport system involved in cytochrome c biogenesis permease component
MISLINFVPSLFLAQESDYPASANAPGPIFWICEAVVIVLIVASMWKIFTKAGQPGWASIIPIYNWIVWCKIVGRPAWWVLLLLICFPIFYIILSIDLAKSFGKGVGFALGLIFLSIIFFPILAFGSATYQGPSAAKAA